MKQFVVVTILAVIALAVAEDCKLDAFPHCDPQVDGSCKAYAPSRCVNFGAEGTADYRCNCTAPAVAKCRGSNDNSSVIIFACISPSATGCGPRFPSGCPEGTICATLANGETTCVCKEPGWMFDGSKCIPKCVDPLASWSANVGRCICKDGYYDSTQGTNAACATCAICLPKPTDGSNCDNYQCPSGTKCVMQSVSGASGTAPTCVADNTQPQCGVDFQCPGNFQCAQTSGGPKCVCNSDKYAGPTCSNPRCTIGDNNTLECDGVHADCITDDSGASYCVCEEGFIGSDCNTADTKCDNVQCTGAFTQCHEGRCICKDGNVPVSDVGAAVLVCGPPNPSVCDNVTCDGNYVCVSKEGKGRCVCPFTTFGGSDCNKPRCVLDSDCPENSYCVTSTNANVAAYCTCKPGFSGDRCRNKTSDECTCPSANQICSNEGRCKCGPGFDGDNCTVTTDCKTKVVFLKFESGTPLTSEQLTVLLAVVVQVDVSNIKISEPVATRDPKVFQYTISFCSDSNVNSASAEQQFNNQVANDNTGLSVVDDPSTANSATGIVASAVMVIAATAAVML